jgi:hypothetical protein
MLKGDPMEPDEDDQQPLKSIEKSSLPEPDLSPGNLYFIKNADFYLTRSSWLVHSFIDLTTFDEPLDDLVGHIRHFDQCFQVVYPNFDLGKGDSSLDAHVTSIRSLLVNYKDIINRQLNVVQHRIRKLKNLQNLKNH